MGGSGVAAVMVVTECLEVGSATLSKAAMAGGMSNFIFVLYTNVVAVLFLVPCCFLFYWKRSRPSLTFPIVCRILLLGVISCSLQMCMILGLRYSSPTLTSAITDLAPAFTFLLAVVSRMEKLDLRIQSSRAKALGTIISIIGALILTLYKGPAIAFFPSSPNSLHEHLENSPSNWVIGGLFLAAGCFFLSLLYIVQTWIIRDYPAELIVTLICCIVVIFESAIVCVIAERDPNAWSLRPGMGLIAIGYSGILLNAFRNVVHTWACRKKGPVYTAMFKPLGMVIAIVMGISFLGETLYLGSVVGSVVIALGFYSVIWGKAKEQKAVEVGAICSSESSSHNAPLLQSKNVEA